MLKRTVMMVMMMNMMMMELMMMMMMMMMMMLMMRHQGHTHTFKTRKRGTLVKTKKDPSSYFRDTAPLRRHQQI